MEEGRRPAGRPDPERIAGDLDRHRRRIDRLDEELVRLLNQRAACADEIGRLKQRVGMEVYQPGRERDVLEHVRRVNAGPLADASMTRLFERIIDESRRLEQPGERGGPEDGRTGS